MLSPPRALGTVGLSAARRMPRSRRTISVAPESRAPVFPAETTASPRPSFSRFSATVMEESGLSRQARAGSSSIVTTSEAFTMETPSGRFPRPRVWKQRRISSPLPTSTSSTPVSWWASMAPFTISRGALSPPMASIMIFMSHFPFRESPALPGA